MDTVFILAYFNFSNSQERTAALLKSLSSLHHKADIIIVAYNLTKEIISILKLRNIQIINIPVASAVWQKERFYNIALSNLKIDFVRLSLDFQIFSVRSSVNSRNKGTNDSGSSTSTR